MHWIFLLITRRNLLILTALILGLIFPYSPTGWVKVTILAVVSLVIAFYLLSIRIRVTVTARFFWVSSLLGIFFSYILLGNVLVWTGAILLYSYDTIWLGFVVLAAAPPVFPELLSKEMFNRRVPFPLMKTMGAYIAALLIVPFMFKVLVDPILLDVKKIVLIVVATLLLPMIISRIIMDRATLRRLVLHNKDYCLDFCFFLITFAIISANAETILNLHAVIIPVVIAILASTFFLGNFLFRVCSFFHIHEETKVSSVLIGTLKDGFIAGGVALYLFPAESTLPAAIYNLVFIFYSFWLQKMSYDKG